MSGESATDQGNFIISNNVGGRKDRTLCRELSFPDLKPDSEWGGASLKESPS